MTPSPIDPTSQPEVLRQLKALLDQGAITAAEYAILKHRALTGPATRPTAAAAPAPPAPPPPTPAPAPSSSAPVPPAPAAELPSLLDMFQQKAASQAAAAAAPASFPPAAPAAPPTELPPPRLVPVEPQVVAPTPVSPPPPPTPPPAEVNFLPPPPAPAAAPPVTPAMPETRPITEFLPPAVAAAPAPPVVMTPVLPPPPAPRPTPAPAPAAPPVDFTGTRPAAAETTASNAAPEPTFQPVPSTRRASRTLSTVLLALGGLALLAVLGYLFLGPDRRNEHLTSRSKTAADSVAVNPETGPQAAPLTLPPTPEPAAEVATTAPAAVPVRPDSAIAPPVTAPKPAATETEEAVFPSRPAPPTPAPTATPTQPAPTPDAPAPAPTPAPAAGSSAPDEPAEPEGPATAPEEGDDAATTRARQALSSYYADLQVPPFNAKQHFAPVVERLYTRQNLTPAAIETELSQSMFPEFKQLTTSIVPGTLRVGPPAADGTRTATYTERSRAFRVSRGKYQRTRTQVRVRFDPNFKMTYMRQEKLLENAFEE